MTRATGDMLSSSWWKTLNNIKGAFVWDQSGIRIMGIMQVSVRLAALPIPEYWISIPSILLPGVE